MVLTISGAVVLVLGKAPVAHAMSARDLAGGGQGFRDVTIAGDPTARTNVLQGGILGGLSTGPASPGPDVRLNPVADAPPGQSGAPAPRTPRMEVLPRRVVPAPRLRPVPERLDGSAGPGSVASPGAEAPRAPMPPASASTPPSAAPRGQPDAPPAPPAYPLVDPLAAPADGQPAATLIRADELRYDRDLDTYRARGNVELTNGERVVMADAVSYNERTDTLTANGNVRVVEADGTTYFANYVELSADFKDGFVRDASVLLADRSRIAAVHATRTEGRRKDFWKAVYTPCDTCPVADGSPWPTLGGGTNAEQAGGERRRMRPVWQVRAAHVTHDEEARDIIYRHATLDLFGVPVAYTPYLRQPDPTVYRRSGLLSPVFGSDEQMGVWAEVPYYVVIDDHQDATIGVRGMADEGWLLHPEYRVRFGSGTLALSGSLTDDDQHGLSGHLSSAGRWHISDVWRAGFDSELVSFDTYRERYGFHQPTWLTNHAWVEAFEGRSHAAIEGFAYNDTRVDRDDELSPVVLPLATYDYISEPGVLGGQALMNASLQGVHRDHGASSTRVSGTVGWQRPGTLSWGLAYSLDARLNADLYAVDDAGRIGGDPDSGYDGTVARVYPSARARLRYPLIRVAPGHRQILEPVVTVAMAPPGLNTRRIPNEDSQDSQITQTNLLTGDRTAGRDRVDDGFSVNYGLRWTYLDNEGGSLSLRFGQAWRAFDDGFFGGASGYGDGFSDYVGSIDAQPVPNLDVYARFRLDREDLSSNTSLLGFRAGTPVLNVAGTYVLAADLNEKDGLDLPEREEIVAAVHSDFSRYWSVRAGARHDLAEDRTVDYWGGLSYEDECLAVALDYSQNYNEVDGDEKGQSLLLRVTFKTLGEISF